MADNLQYLQAFKDLGIGMKTEEQLLQEKKQEKLAAGVAAGRIEQESFRGERDLRGGGAAIGAALGAMMSKPKLSKEEQVMVDAQKYANKATDLMRESGEFGDQETGTFDAVAYGETRMEKMAEYMLEQGDLRGMELAAQVYNNRQIRERDKRERVKHDLDVEEATFDLEKERWGFDRDKFLVARGELTTIYPRGSNNPNSGLMAFVDDSGTALTKNADGEYVPFALGEYTIDRPIDPTKGKGGGGKSPFIPPPSKQEEMRAHQRSIVQQMNLSSIMMDAMSTAIAESPKGTLDIMDGSGKFEIFAVNLANNINSVFRQGEQWVGLTDGDPNDPNAKVVGRLDGSLGSSMAYVKNNAEYMDSVIPVPQGIEKGSIQAQRYQAAIVQLAYAKARSNEPGARQLSDNDFKNAIKQIGADATNPEAFRQVMMDNVNLADNDFDFWRMQYSQEVVDGIIPPAAMREYERVKDKWQKSFDSFWGTASNPQGTLLEDAATKRETAPKGETPEERKARLLKQ